MTWVLTMLLQQRWDHLVLSTIPDTSLSHSVANRVKFSALFSISKRNRHVQVVLNRQISQDTMIWTGMQLNKKYLFPLQSSCISLHCARGGSWMFIDPWATDVTHRVCATYFHRSQQTCKETSIIHFLAIDLDCLEMFGNKNKKLLQFLIRFW